MSRALAHSPSPLAPAQAEIRAQQRGASPFADRPLLTGAGLALALANARYWSSVAPLVRGELARWQRRAREIPDPLLRALATGKLREERFNVEAAATLATLVARSRRAHALTAMVALQAMYDYLDVLTERPAREELLADAIGGGQRLFVALADAFAPTGGGPCREDYHRYMPHAQDGGYLRALVETVSRSMSTLPATGAIAEVAQVAAERCGHAQLLGHAAGRLPSAEVERWAREQAGHGPLGWPEFLAGASASVLGLHALIAAAADERTTRAEAERIDALYLSIGALSMLDSLIDRERDLADGRWGYADCYQSPEQMARALADVARGAARDAQTLPHAAHHTMTLVGVVAYYASAPAARSPFARAAFARLHDELRPLIVPTTALMRAWRTAKSVRAVATRTVGPAR